MRVALIHNVYGAPDELFGGVFVLRAVQRINRFLRIDLTVVSGYYHATVRGEVQAALARLQMPWINCSTDLESPPAEPELPEGLQPLSAELPALTLAPFDFTVAERTAAGEWRLERQTLTLPEIPDLTDFHVHTRLAYCQENLDADKTLRLAALAGVRFVSFSEHSSHLALNWEDYRSKRWIAHGLDGETPVSRSAEFTEVLAAARFPLPHCRGSELDIDGRGRLVALPEELAAAKVRVGAVHYLPPELPEKEFREEFLFRTRRLLEQNMDVLAHPFRVFRRSGLPVPKELFRPVAELLKASSTAAEINFHTNDPEPEFFDLCVSMGVKLSFGSDSHNLYEVGDFYPHLEFVRQLGVYGQLDKILLSCRDLPGLAGC